jgi:hypothetical protein
MYHLPQVALILHKSVDNNLIIGSLLNLRSYSDLTLVHTFIYEHSINLANIIMRIPKQQILFSILSSRSISFISFEETPGSHLQTSPWCVMSCLLKLFYGYILTYFLTFRKEFSPEKQFYSAESLWSFDLLDSSCQKVGFLACVTAHTKKGRCDHLPFP